jgi:hypothetical protein
MVYKTILFVFIAFPATSIPFSANKAVIFLIASAADIFFAPPNAVSTIVDAVVISIFAFFATISAHIPAFYCLKT